MPPIPTNRPISGLRVVPKLSESESSSFDFGFCFAAHSYDIMYPNQTNKLKVNAILSTSPAKNKENLKKNLIRMYA